MIVARLALLLGLVAPLIAQDEAVEQWASQPNIVLIVADDLGWNDIGYHNKDIRTPNLDRMQREGVELDQCYVQPQCTPTRVALMTGRYPSRIGRHCCQASNARAFPRGTATLASELRRRGYDTGIFGKWHLGSKPEWGPKHYGFAYSYGSFAGAVGMYDHRYRLKSPFAKTWHRNHEYCDDEGHATDIVTDEAIRWIRRRREGPFFCYVPYHAVHTPLVERDRRWLEANAHIEQKDRRLFAAAVSHMDDAIGRIVKALEEAQLRKDTILIFVSDNGAQVNHRGGAYPPPDPQLHNFSSNAPLRGQKTHVFEGGMRVPALVSWPGVLSARKVKTPMHAVDFLPTLVSLAGPGDARKQSPAEKTTKQGAERSQQDQTKAARSGLPAKLDGRNVWTFWTGQATGYAEDRTLYWVWGGKRQRVALRHGRHKVLRNGARQAWKLFDLDADPYEKANLAKDKPELLAAMLERVRAERERDAK